MLLLQLLQIACTLADLHGRTEFPQGGFASDFENGERRIAFVHPIFVVRNIEHHPFVERKVPYLVYHVAIAVVLGIGIDPDLAGVNAERQAHFVEDLRLCPAIIPCFLLSRLYSSKSSAFMGT